MFQSELSISGPCAYALNYTVTLRNSSDSVLEQILVTSDSCVDDITYTCSVSITLPSATSTDEYFVTVVANSAFGSSNTTVTIAICELKTKLIGNNYFSTCTLSQVIN